MFSLVIIYYDDLSGNLQDLGSRSAFTGEMVYFIFVFHPNILMIYVIKIIKITFHSSFFFIGFNLGTLFEKKMLDFKLHQKFQYVLQRTERDGF